MGASVPEMQARATLESEEVVGARAAAGARGGLCSVMVAALMAVEVGVGVGATVAAAAAAVLVVVVARLVITTILLVQELGRNLNPIVAPKKSAEIGFVCQFL